MKYLFLLLLLIGCTPDFPRERNPVQENEGRYTLIKQYDAEYGVVCYRFYGYDGTSCVRVEEISKSCKLPPAKDE